MKSKTDSELPNPVIQPDPPVYKTRAPRKSERQLRVNFTDAELMEKGRVIGEKHSERARIESEFDSVKAQFKERLARVEAEIAETAGYLHTGFRYSNVACEITFDNPAKGKKSTRRLDTGETVETEMMTMDESQGELSLSPTKGVDGEGNVRVEADQGGEGGQPAGKD